MAPRSNKKGFFITVEGIDGCGKSTAIELLGKKLRAVGLEDQLVELSTFTTDEFTRNIRQTLIDPSLNMSPAAYAYMVLALHIHNYFKYIKPNLERDNIVLLDRSIISTMVFQLDGEQGIVDGHNDLCLLDLDYLQPDLTVVINTDVMVARERLKSRNNGEDDRIEKQGLEKQYRYAYLYNTLKLPEDRKTVIDNNGSIHNLISGIGDVVQTIINTLQERVEAK